jgi:SOS response regulatory protein OraA/RecX
MEDVNKTFEELKAQFDSGEVFFETEAFNELEDTATFKHAIKILARKDYSRSKLIQKLKDRECPRDEIEPVIDLLIEKQWFKEELYTEGRTKYFVRKGYHPKTIKTRLAEESVYTDIEFIYAVMKEQQVTIQDQVRDLILKRLPVGEMPERLPDKVMRYIVNRGHSFQDILDVFRETRKEF